MELGFRRVGTGTADIRRDDIDRVLTVLRTGRLSAGPFMADFERRFAEKHGRKYASMCNSGTGALQLSLQALKEQRGWPDGAEVIVPAMTFVATINVVLYNNLKPILVDVDPMTFTMDPLALVAAKSPRTVAVMPVHLYGQPADMSRIMSLADGLAVIEDSCEAVAVKHYGKPVGSFGDIACFSTYMAHHVTTGVGGLAITDDKDLATRFASLMNHGRNPIYTRIDDDDDVPAVEALGMFHSRYQFVSLGQSFRVTEMEAALGLGQLLRIDEAIRQRQRIAGWLTERLTGLPLQLPYTAEGNEHSYMMYPMLALEPGLRDKIVVALEGAGVETRPLMPILSQPCYEDVLDWWDIFPVAERAIRDGFFVGCHQGMSLADVEHIADVIRSCI